MISVKFNHVENPDRVHRLESYCYALQYRTHTLIHT